LAQIAPSAFFNLHLLAMAVRLRAAVFDFDGTLTVLPELPRHRVFPKFDMQEPDATWLREVAFGGSARLDLLLRTLDELQRRWGLELFVASFADRDMVVKVLEMIGGLRYFGAEPAEVESFRAHIFGRQELGGPFAKKGDFLQWLLRERGWRHGEVLFLDDQADNVRSARPVCLTHWVRRAQGLSSEELELLRTTGGAGVLNFAEQSPGGPCTEHDTDMSSNATEWSCSSFPGLPSPDNKQALQAEAAQEGSPVELV